MKKLDVWLTVCIAAVLVCGCSQRMIDITVNTEETLVNGEASEKNILDKALKKAVGLVERLRP